MSKFAGVAYHPVNGSKEEIYEGFSWPCFFLGFIWYIYKGMWRWGVIHFLVALVLCFSLWFLLLLYWPLFAFFANDQYAKSLIANGYLNEKQWKERNQANAGTVMTTRISQHEVSFLADELEKLAALKEKGILTEEEWSRQKQRLLNG